MYPPLPTAIMNNESSVNEQSAPSYTPNKPSLLACLSCRQKHLRCDSRRPTCGRCESTGTHCEFTPSRRGYKGHSKKRRVEGESPERNIATTEADAGKVNFMPGWQMAPPIPGSAPASTASFYPQTVLNATLAPPQQMTFMPSQPASETATTTAIAPAAAAPNNAMISLESKSSLANDSYLVNVYYSDFHPAHPILPPPRFFDRYVPFYLVQVMKFIGAHFSPSASPDTYRGTVVSDVQAQPPSPEKVQALLLLTIVLHSRNERNEAGQLLAQAMDMAYGLGMHRRSFADTHGEGDPIRKESLRRTWWELFVIEGMLTALGIRKSFTANATDLEVPLPCEERLYQDGLCPLVSPTVAQFDDRIFADEDIDFSSYAYRIEAVRILGRVVELSHQVQNQQDQVEAIDARISSFFHHLPESKTELMRADNTVDEVMFQAMMVVNGASIYLHFPRSDLLSSPAVAAEVICGHPGLCMMPAFSHHSHAMRAVKAASEISSLAAMRTPVTKHTPFFICALVLSSIVQLAACSVKARQMPDPKRDRLTLTVGVFKSMGRTWAISQSVMRQIKAVARDVLEIGVRPTVDENNINIDFTSLLQNDQLWLPEQSVSS